MMNKILYEDVLDDLDEIRPDVQEEESAPAYVTEQFDPSPYPIFFSIRIPHFNDNVPEGKRADAASAIASFITEIFTDASLQTETSFIYALGTSEEFAHKSFLERTAAWFNSGSSRSIILYFGLSFGRRLTVKQCLRILFRIDAVSAFVKRRFYTDPVASSKEPISLYCTMEGKYVIKSMIATNSMTVREYVSDAIPFGSKLMKFDRITDILRRFPTKCKTAEEIRDKLQKAIIPEDAQIFFAE